MRRQRGTTSSPIVSQTLTAPFRSSKSQCCLSQLSHTKVSQKPLFFLIPFFLLSVLLCCTQQEQFSCGLKMSWADSVLGKLGMLTASNINLLLVVTRRADFGPSSGSCSSNLSATSLCILLCRERTLFLRKQAFPFKFKMCFTFTCMYEQRLPFS